MFVAMCQPLRRKIYYQMYGSPTTPVLENPEYQTRWYFKYFLGKRKYKKGLITTNKQASLKPNEIKKYHHLALWSKFLEALPSERTL